MSSTTFSGTIVTAPSGHARPTTTRAQLRQAIGMELAMPFYRRYGTESTITGSTDTTSIEDTTLTQADDYWNNAWFLITEGADAGKSRLITDFASTTALLTIERALTMASDNAYEILSVFSPEEVHYAINRAISDAFPAFFDITTDETLVIQEDRLQYDLTGLATRPWLMTKVWFEMISNGWTGTPTATDATSLTDSDADFSDGDTDWRVSIYDGTGRGQWKDFASVTGTTKINVATWTTTPATTSKYRVWDSAEQEYNDYRVLACRFDRKEYPERLYLTQKYPSLYGSRIRLEYTSVPAELTAESSTTIIPKEFIISRALSYLCGSKVNDNRADRARYIDLERMYREKAEMYRQTHAWQQPSISLWQEEEAGRVASYNLFNPLGW